MLEATIMGLNIKNPEIHPLAEELARRTGESMTAAVTTAVRERLDRVRREQGASSLADRLLEIGQDCAKRLKEPFRSGDPDTLLYDDRGLPR
jgi:antitoxin VapB